MEWQEEERVVRELWKMREAMGGKGKEKKKGGNKGEVEERE